MHKKKLAYIVWETETETERGRVKHKFEIRMLLHALNER